MSNAQIVKRLDALERDVNALKGRLRAQKGSQPWWKQIAGTFKNDPAFAQATKLGRAYRKGKHGRARA
jgi:hypothetical protein